MGDRVENNFTANLVTFSNKIVEVQKKLEERKQISADQWQTIQFEIEHALDEIEITYDYLNRKVSFWTVEQLLADYEKKMDDLRRRSSEVSAELKQIFHEEYDNFRATFNEA